MSQAFKKPKIFDLKSAVYCFNILAGIMLMPTSSFASKTAFINAKIYDGHQFLSADAMISEHGRLLSIGQSAEIIKRLNPNDTVLNLNGALVTPGFIEAHAHLLGIGQSVLKLDLRGLQLKQILEKIKHQSTRQAPASWIKGRGWDQNLWPNKAFPHAIMLDALSLKHPVYLHRVDGHAAWVNTIALGMAGITKNTPDPDGGQIIRDAHGQPTGVLIDNAINLIAKLIAEPSKQELEHYLELGVKQALSFGITSFHDAGASRKTLDLYQEKARLNQLELRIYAMIDGEDSKLVNDYLAMGPQITSDYLAIRSIKYFADGALGSRGASLLSDYHDQPGAKGLMLISHHDLANKTSLALKKGFQVATHAIGDQANRMVLDAYQQALSENPTGDYRLRIEHAQLIDPRDHQRLKQLSVIASMQPIHCTADMAWVVERLGPDRLTERAYPWRSLLKQGVILAFGSDGPVEPINPIKGLYAAVSRSDEAGLPENGFMPEQKLSLKEALTGFFSGAAWAEFNERHKGKLAPGYMADFVVWNEDILHARKSAFLAAHPIMTVVGGEVKFRR